MENQTARPASNPQSGSTTKVNTGGGLEKWFAPLVIVGAIIVAELLYHLWFGSPSNFKDNNPANNPKPGGLTYLLGLFHKGGFLVPFGVGMFLIVVTFSIERIISLGRAAGTGNVNVFVQKIQMHLSSGNVNEAIKECDKFKGSVGNVTKEVLTKYREVVDDSKLDKEAKMASVSKALEESIALELPVLQQNLSVIATIVSIATLVGLIGTVIGMIRAFSALATAGAPDPVSLATGISEALINTALGISTSTVATIAYNYFTSRIDGMSYKMDEIGYSIVQSLAEKK